MTTETTRQSGADNAVDKKCWHIHSNFTVRQDAVGRCAEENGGTPKCVPGVCEMCCNCSFNRKSN
jgi:hypothetical protein